MFLCSDVSFARPCNYTRRETNSSVKLLKQSDSTTKVTIDLTLFQSHSLKVPLPIALNPKPENERRQEYEID